MIHSALTFARMLTPHQNGLMQDAFGRRLLTSLAPSQKKGLTGPFCTQTNLTWSTTCPTVLVCDDCETLIQAPVPAQVIDKGIPTAGLLAHVMIAKFADHLPLYRQESIFGRAGLAIPRSTLAQWVGVTGVQLQPLVDALRDVVIGQQVVHADETPVQMLAPGSKKTHRSYVWAYATSQFCETAAVVYDFSPSRAGEHARNFLQGWKGKLVCDDFGGYKASFELGVTEIGCMAHARRKFFELHVTNKSQLAEQALRYIQLLY